MARPRKTDEELMVVPIRLPRRFVERVDEVSELLGVSRSDVIRPRIDCSDLTPISVTGHPAPQRRQRIDKASSADPKLLMQLSGIGNNINQIARAVNTEVQEGKSLDAISLLIALEGIERQLKRLSAESINAD